MSAINFTDNSHSLWPLEATMTKSFNMNNDPYDKPEPVMNGAQ